MATPGGGGGGGGRLRVPAGGSDPSGGGRLRVPAGGSDPSGGGGDGRVRQRLLYEGGEEEQCSAAVDSEQLPLLQSTLPSLAESQRAWSSAGNTSSDNPFSHYVSDGG
ncbi:hypothetical protein ACQJBY_068674 [Aegilops geniculata]